jgi:radical SAM superfamily enzyme YgiQ (UPF0313 family)
MSSVVSLSLQPSGTACTRRIDGKVMLIKPPYFTPWTPPLGIAILKSFLEQNRFSTKCFDFNVDPELWGMHHKYFATLQEHENVSGNDGYSRLWWILNPHMLAYVNGASPASCAKVIESIAPMYGVRCNRRTVSALLPLVEKFFCRLEELISQVEFEGFAAIGTSTYSTSLAASLFILRQVKQRYPRVLTIMGGGIFADDLALGSDNLATLIDEYPFIDHVVLGEGEVLLLELLEGRIAHKKVLSLSDLQGKTLEMKDVPPPDFSDLSRDSYYHLTIEGARSCPFQCSFCSETVQWGNYRKKPTDIFVDQVVELATKYNNQAFFMGDSLMNPYLNPFASELIKRGAKIIYDGYLRADKPVANPQFAKLWADSGLYRVRLGIESAAARVLSSMNKMITPAVISEVLKNLAKMGIRTTTYWIVGFPGETEKDFEETCNFIREHHKFIYELEAHPYYYYPYGQIGSRLYQCHSLYPDEVTKIIKFKVWEINNADPRREVRYDRLRRLSKLASTLGLPNIYTMADRYQAEDRWHDLHPLAVEAFEGTKGNRGQPALPDLMPIEVMREWQRTFAAGAAGANPVLCYRILVQKEIHEGLLAAAIDQLVSYNEMLQLSLSGGSSLRALAGPPSPNLVILTLAQNTEDGGEISPDIRRRIEEIAAEILPEPGASLRVALASKGDSSSELFLLVHRAIADSRGVLLLSEDLFRIYEQLAYGRPVSLRPVSRSFVDLITALAESGRTGECYPDLEILYSARGAPETLLRHQPYGGSGGKEDVLRLERDLSARLADSQLDKIDSIAIIVSSLLLSLASELAEENPVIDILSDYRFCDITLTRTVGPLNQFHRLSPSFLNKDGLPSIGRRLRSILRGSYTDGAIDGSSNRQDCAGAPPLLVNLEYLAEDPWLGGNEWRPRGFVTNEYQPRSGYQLEISPVRFDQAIKFRFRSQNGSRMEKAVENIMAALPGFLVAALQRSGTERLADPLTRDVFSFETGITATNQ